MEFLVAVESISCSISSGPSDCEESAPVCVEEEKKKKKKKKKKKSKAKTAASEAIEGD